MSRVNLRGEEEETMMNINNNLNSTNRSLADTNTNNKLVLNPSKAGFFLKNLRRRSKTYSGEELQSQLEKRINEQKSSNDYNRSEPRLKVSPLTDSKKSLTLKEKLLKRTNFTLNNYGSIELLFSLDREGIIQNIGKFRIENGNNQEVSLNTSNTIHLENPECQTRWYFKYFLGRVHQNYLIEDKNKTISFLSVVVTDANELHIPQYKIILWTKNGSQKLTLPYQNNKPTTVKLILNHFQIETDKSPREILDPELQRELLILEEQEGSINFKFGIVYSKHGQLTDDEMFSNEHGSTEFEKFINLIGDKIRLKGWKKYKGGLDTTTDTTGEYSIYTIYEGHEIMFHVSVLLPYLKESKQQIERKRHIGNDIVTIVFQDVDDQTEPDFTPSSARSQFQHIFALITYNKKENSYRLKIYSEHSVPPFGPSLPVPPVFTNHKEFREFLLVKLINGEKSAFNNTVFGKRRKRTIEAIINNLHTTYDRENFKNKYGNMTTSGISEALSDVLSSANVNHKRKEELRKAEFLRIGQKLKLQTIIKGDAPTSQITTAVAKKELWEPQVFLQMFANSIICSDSWNNCLLVATINGVYVIDEAIPWDLKLIFDKTVQVRQLDVWEQYGLLVMLLEKGRICIFKLSELSQLLNESSNLDQAKTKYDCRQHRLEFIHACNVYTIKKQPINSTDTFKIIAACGRKLIIIESNLNAQSNICDSCIQQPSISNTINEISNLTLNNTATTNQIDSNSTPNLNDLTNDITSLFHVRKEINCSDIPCQLNLIESVFDDNIYTQYILIAYKNKCELISEKTGECLRYIQFSQMCTIKSIVELYDNNKLELLITHNNCSEFFKLDQRSLDSSLCIIAKSYFTFQWNIIPNNVFIIFPYAIGFSLHCIEIRLLVNGSLVNSITLPNIKFITSKKEIFFSAGHKSFVNELNERFNTIAINVTNPMLNHVTLLSDDQSPPQSPVETNLSTSTTTTSSKSPISPQTSNTASKESPCTIYKINLDFLNHSNMKTNEKFYFNQLCEDSTRVIQRDISNIASQFIFNDNDNETSKQYSVYQRIINSNMTNYNDPINENTSDSNIEQE